MDNIFNITDFGAISDGKTDCTAFIQEAIDKAALVQGTVYVPSGAFLTKELVLKPFVTIRGDANWTYKKNGGSILILFDESSKCMINITAAYGAKITSICMDGRNIGNGIHGIATIREDEEPLVEEDTTCIDSCRVSNFSGDGLHMQRIWCFTVRHSQIAFNRGHGLFVRGWDAFISDNWFSGNHGCGICSTEVMSAMVITANRIEWNHQAGIKAINPCGCNITGNAFDSSGGPGLDLCNPKGTRSINVTITGNTFSRSGMPLIRDCDCGPSCHVHMERAMNVILTGNNFYEGFDDGGNRGLLCPETGIIIKKLHHCVIKDNTMFNCATKNVYIDEGEHLDNNIIDIKGTTKDKVEEWLFPFFED